MKNFLYKYKRKISFIFAVFLVVLLVKVINTTDTLTVYPVTKSSSDIKASSDGKYIVELDNNKYIHIFDRNSFFVEDGKPIHKGPEIKDFTFKDPQTLIMTTIPEDTAYYLYRNRNNKWERKGTNYQSFKDLHLLDFNSNKALLQEKYNPYKLYLYEDSQGSKKELILEDRSGVEDAKFWDKEKIILLSQDKNNRGTIQICEISRKKCEDKKITINEFNDSPNIILSPSRKYLALKYIPDDKTTTIRVWKINNNDEFQEITDNLEELKKRKPGTVINSATFLESGKDTELIVIKNP